MKKVLFFLVFFVAFVTLVEAQVVLEKGTKLQQVGGRLNIGLNTSLIDVGLNYKRGWFLSPKFVLGADIEAGYANDGSDGSFSLNAGGFTRAYFSKADANTLFFGQASLGLGLIPDPFYYASSNFTTQISVGPGISFRIGENVMLDFSLPYQARIVADDQTYHNIYGTFGVAFVLPPTK